MKEENITIPTTNNPYIVQTWRKHREYPNIIHRDKILKYGCLNIPTL